MIKTIHLAGVLLGGMAIAAPVAAATFGGTINLSGQVAAQNSAGAGASFATATVLDFCASPNGACELSPGGTGMGQNGQFEVDAATGNLGVTTGDLATVLDLSIAGFNHTPAPNPIASFFVFGNGLTFNMGQMSVRRDELSGQPFLLITSLGTLTLGTQSSPAQFTFSVQGDAFSPDGSSFSFSGRTLAPLNNGGGGGDPIPTPAAFALFGAGLLGLAVARRRGSSARA